MPIYTAICDCHYMCCYKQFEEMKLEPGELKQSTSQSHGGMSLMNLTFLQLLMCLQSLLVLISVLRQQC